MTEIRIKAYLVGRKIEEFDIVVNENNYIMIRKKLISEFSKILKILERMKAEGKIKSIYIPKNKEMQERLNELVVTKKGIHRSLDKIKAVFI